MPPAPRADHFRVQRTCTGSRKTCNPQSSSSVTVISCVARAASLRRSGHPARTDEGALTALIGCCSSQREPRSLGQSVALADSSSFASRVQPRRAMTRRDPERSQIVICRTTPAQSRRINTGLISAIGGQVQIARGPLRRSIGRPQRPAVGTSCRTSDHRACSTAKAHSALFTRPTTTLTTENHQAGPGVPSLWFITPGLPVAAEARYSGLRSSGDERTRVVGRSR